MKTNHLQLTFEREEGGVVAGGRNNKKKHLQLAFECKGGGVVGDRLKEQKETTSIRKTHFGLKASQGSSDALGSPKALRDSKH